MQSQPPDMPTDDEISSYVDAVMDDHTEFLRAHPAEMKEISRRYLLVITSMQLKEEKAMPLLRAFHDEIGRLSFTMFSIGYVAGRNYVAIPEVFQEPQRKPLPWHRRLAALVGWKHG